MLCFQEDGEEIQDRANMLISNFGAVQCKDGGVGSDGKLKCKWLASSEGSCLFKHQDSDMLLKGKGVTKDLEKGRPGTPPRAVTGDGGSVLDPTMAGLVPRDTFAASELEFAGAVSSLAKTIFELYSSNINLIPCKRAFFKNPFPYHEVDPTFFSPVGSIRGAFVPRVSGKAFIAS